MSLLNNPEKTGSSQTHSIAHKSKITQETLSFEEKLREVKSIIASLLPPEKQHEVFGHLQELHDIYLADTQKDRQKFDRNIQEEARGRRSEKVILEVREGNKLARQVKIEGQVRPKSPKSPEKKAEEKKFMKFEPKKAKGEVTPGLGNILKTG